MEDSFASRSFSEMTSEFGHFGCNALGSVGSLDGILLPMRSCAGLNPVDTCGVERYASSANIGSDCRKIVSPADSMDLRSDV